MDKVTVDAAVSAMESSIHNIDFWALICGIVVAIFLAGEIWFIGAHWLKESTLKPLRERQAQLDELELQRLKNETASANKATEELRRENFDIRTKIAGRRITAEQHQILVSELSKSPGFFHIESMTDGESALYASDLSKTLKAAHWTSDTPEFPLGEVWEGLIIFQTDDPAALRIALALKAANIPFSIGDDQHKKERATILVGAKPSPF